MAQVPDPEKQEGEEVKKMEDNTKTKRKKIPPRELRIKAYNGVRKLRKRGLPCTKIGDEIYRKYGVWIDTTTISKWLRGVSSPYNGRRIPSLELLKTSEDLGYVISGILGGNDKFYLSLFENSLAMMHTIDTILDSFADLFQSHRYAPVVKFCSFVLFIATATSGNATKDATSRIAAKYRYLFRPPGSRLAPALIVVTSVLIGVVLEGGLPPPTGLAVWLLSLGLGPIAVNLIASRTVFARSVIATSRRLIMMTLLENYFLLAGAAIGTLSALVTSSSGLAYSTFLASLSLSAYVRTTVLSTFDGRRWKEVVAGFAGSLVRVVVGLTREELALPSLVYVLWGLSLSISSILILLSSTG
jgi:hypothetical protein